MKLSGFAPGTGCMVLKPIIWGATTPGGGKKINILIKKTLKIGH